MNADVELVPCDAARDGALIRDPTPANFYHSNAGVSGGREDSAQGERGAARGSMMRFSVGLGRMARSVFTGSGW